MASNPYAGDYYSIGSSSQTPYTQNVDGSWPAPGGGAPPNSTWNPTTGRWDVTAPGTSGYDPTWGGYVPVEDLTADNFPDSNPWLKSVFEHQGWPMPGEEGTPSPTPSPDHSGGSGGDSGRGGTVINQWTNYQPRGAAVPGTSADSALASLYQSLAQRQAQMTESASAQERQQAAQRQALVDELWGRARQSMEVDSRTDPNIRAQVDPQAAAIERSGRNYLADLAEQMGPNANLRPEQRLVAERSGQASGLLEAQLVGQELQARRQEIQSALEQMGNMLTAEQRNTLQMQLALLDSELASINSQLTGRDQDLSYQLGARGQDLGFNIADMTSGRAFDLGDRQLGSSDFWNWWDRAFPS